MSQYNTINAGETERFFTVLARADGSPIEAGTVNYYLRAKSGANAGKYWNDATEAWDVAKTANAMTHEDDGHWEIDLTSSPFSNGVRYIEYVEESGDLHVPQARHLIGSTVDTPQTADHTAAIADIPTVAEFEARTLLAAAYFDPDTDTVTTDAASRTASKADVSALATAAGVWSYTTRTLTQSAASVTAVVSGSDITVTRGDTWSIALTGLGSVAARSNLWFTAKRGHTETDSEAICQVDLTTGLLYIWGASPAAAGNASITVDDEDAGNITITVDEVETAKVGIVPNGIYDVQMLDTSGNVSTMTTGDFETSYDATRATS